MRVPKDIRRVTGRSGPYHDDVDVTVATATRPTARWIGPAWADQLMVWSWVPFAIIGAVVADPRALIVVITLTLAFSFSHQLLTLPLVYGDRDTFRSRRLVFLVAPIVLLIGIAVIRSRAFLLLALVAAGWNAFHTVQQRYGLVRIYGRKVGQDRPGVERWLLFAGFAAAVTLAVASPRLGEGLGDGVLDLGQPGSNTAILDLLISMQSAAAVVAVPVLVVVVVLGAVWWTQERVRPANPAKRWYLASTMCLFAVAPFAPLAALLGFVGSHAVEYYVVVARSLRARTDTKPDSNLARVTRAARPWPAVVVFGVGGAVAVYALMLGGWVDAFAVLALTFGAMHFLFDGLIWRSGRPAYSATFRPSSLDGGSSALGVPPE